MDAWSSQQGGSRIPSDAGSSDLGIAGQDNWDAILDSARRGGYPPGGTVTSRASLLVEGATLQGEIMGYGLTVRRILDGYQVETDRLGLFCCDAADAIRTIERVLTVRADATQDEAPARRTLGGRPVAFARCRANACGYDLDELVAEQVCGSIL